MTTITVPKVCDFCGLKIESEMKYKLQLSQRSVKGKSKKGQFVKCANDMDMCHECFMSCTKVGFKPDWVTLKKDEAGKWTELEEQEKIA